MSAWRRTTNYIIIAFSVLAVVGLLLISYSVVLYLIGGLIIAQVALLIILRLLVTIASIEPSLEELTENAITAPLIIITLAIAGIFLFFFKPPSTGYLTVSCIEGQSSQKTIVKDYRGIIEPVNFSKGTFRVLEEVTYDVEDQNCVEHKIVSTPIEQGIFLSLPEREVHSSSRGIFIRELHLIPLERSTISGATFYSDQITLELRDFPRDSFYEARDISKPDISTYLDTETVKWNYLSRNEIVFAYIAPPFYALRNLVMPLVGLSYQSQWIFVVVGLVVSAVFTPIVKPVFLDLAKSRFKDFIDRKKQTKDENVKTTIIVSSRGEEKEIEVNKRKN